MKLKALSVTSFVLLTCLYLSCAKGNTPTSPASATVANIKVPIASLSHALNGNNNNVADYQLYYVVNSPSSAAITGTVGPIPNSQTASGYYDFSVNVTNSSYNLISIQVNDAQAQTVIAVGAEAFTFVPGSTLPVTLGPMHMCYAPVTVAAGSAYGFEGNTTSVVGANMPTGTAGLDMLCNVTLSGGYLLQNAALANSTVAFMGNGKWVNYLTVPAATNFFISSGSSKGFVTNNDPNNPNNYTAAIGDVYCVKILTGGYAWLQVTGFTGTGIIFDFRPNTTLNYCGYEQTTVDKSGACGNNGTPVPTWVPLGSAGFTASTAAYISTAFDNSNNPYVAFQDGANGNKATVMEYVGGAWVNVGLPGFTPGVATYLSLQIMNNIPFVAFSDGNSGAKASVMEFTGGSWVNLGTPDFSTGTASYISMVMNASVTYVGYADAGLSGGVVEQYNGTWSILGGNAFTPSTPTYLSLAVNPTNNYAYVAYGDGGAGNKVSAQIFNGTWLAAGNADFSAGAATYISLGIDTYNNNYPYVVYDDSNYLNKAVMMYLPAAAWTAVGSPTGFTPNTALYSSIAFNSQGPFVAFADGSDGNAATAMAYLSNNWVNVGNTDFSANSSGYLSCMFAGNPTSGFIVAYQDGAHLNSLTVEQFQ